MLYSIEQDGYKAMNHVPHKEDFDRWMSNLSRDDYDRIYGELHSVFDESSRKRDEGSNEPGAGVETSSFIPGSDWTGTVWEPIWHACERDVDRAALFFGLIVWKVVMEHPDPWAFGRYLTDRGIQGTTYFRIDSPEA